jgi:hypothetical protein
MQASEAVGQDVILRADCQPALCDPSLSVGRRVSDPPQVGNLPHGRSY